MEEIVLLISYFTSLIYGAIYVTFCGMCVKYAGRLQRNQFFWTFATICFTPFVTAIMLHCLGNSENFKNE
jgi:hypothetical protein